MRLGKPKALFVGTHAKRCNAPEDYHWHESCQWEAALSQDQSEYGILPIVGSGAVRPMYRHAGSMARPRRFGKTLEGLLWRVRLIS